MVAFLLGLIGTQDFGHDVRCLDVAQTRSVEVGVIHCHTHVAVGTVDVALIKQAVGNSTERGILADAALQVTLGALNEVLHLFFLVTQLAEMERHRAGDDGI